MTIIYRVLISFGIIIIASCLRHIFYKLFVSGILPTVEDSDFHFRLIIAVILLGWVIGG